MEVYTGQQLSASEKNDIFRIWNSVYPKQISWGDLSAFEDYLLKCKNATHVLEKNSSNVIGWLCVFTRDGERWFALIIDPQFQRKGIGKKLLSKMKALEPEVSGWVVTPLSNYVTADGSTYESPIAFYEQQGFAITNETFETDVLSTVKIVWKNS